MVATIVDGLEVNAFSEARMRETERELREERDSVRQFDGLIRRGYDGFRTGTEGEGGRRLSPSGL